MVPLAYFLLLFLMIIVPVPTKINEKTQMLTPPYNVEIYHKSAEITQLKVKKEPF